MLHINLILMRYNEDHIIRDLFQPQEMMEGAYSLVKRLDEAQLMLQQIPRDHRKVQTGSANNEDETDEESSWSEIEVIEVEDDDSVSQSRYFGTESRISWTQEFGTMTLKAPSELGGGTNSDFAWTGLTNA